MTLDEIFKTNPALLDAPEVKELIEYVREQHKRTYGIAQRHIQFHSQVFDLCMYSEVILIEGKSGKDTVKDILTILEKF